MSLMILWRKEFIEVVILCSIIVSTYSLNLIPEGYDPHIRPNGPDGEPVVVGISLVINSINEVDEREMSIVLEVYIRVAWHDPRLVIPPNLYNDSDCEDIPLNNEIIEDLHLWLPDPTIERVQDMHSAKLLQGFSGVRLSRDAKIMWGKWFLINLRCAMFFHNFPFDMQTCHLDISSYFYGTSDMLFTWEGNGIHASPDIPKLLSNYIFTFHQENVTSCYSVNYINDQYPCLKSVMTFTRRYRSYMMGVYFPSFIFVIVAWASFFWPPDAIPARTVLLITTLLATISLYAGVQQITPPTNYTRAIDNWFFACIVAIASALFQYAVILQIRKLQTTRRNVKDISKCFNVKVGKRCSVNDAQALEEKSYGKSVCEVIENAYSFCRLRTVNNKETEYWHKLELQVENGARVLYIIFFIIFNLIYWVTYL